MPTVIRSLSDAEKLVMRVAAMFLLCSLLVSSAKADAVDDYVKDQMQTQHIPGLSLAIVQNGKVVKEQGYGFADVSTKSAATLDTSFRLASVTKQFVAAGIMLLVQEGRCDLDKPISSYVYRTPPNWSRITVRNLLTQTSGIPDFLNELHFHPKAAVTSAQLVAYLSSQALDFAPGERWSYSNSGYALLAMVITRVTGEPWGTYLQEAFFTPLKMTHTLLDNVPTAAQTEAVRYYYDSPHGAYHECPLLNPTTYDIGNAGISSSVSDLIKWDAALASGTLLVKDSLSQMWSPMRLADGSSAPYGFGWFLTPYRNHALIEHTGSDPGAETIISRFPDDHLTVIILANIKGAPVTAMSHKIAAIYIPGLDSLPGAPVTDTQPVITNMVRTVMLEEQSGTTEERWFTPETWAIIYPAKLQSAQGHLKAAGVFQSIALMAHSIVNGQYYSEYRVVFQNATYACRSWINQDGRISGFLFKPE